MLSTSCSKVSVPDSHFPTKSMELPLKGLDLLLCKTAQYIAPWISYMLVRHRPATFILHGKNWRKVVLLSNYICSLWPHMPTVNKPLTRATMDWMERFPCLSWKECCCLYLSADVSSIFLLMATWWLYILAFKEFWEIISWSLELVQKISISS